MLGALREPGESPSDPTELALIKAIANGDDASYQVYADWLEQRGDLARAEFLRAQDLVAASDGVAPPARTAAARSERRRAEQQREAAAQKLEALAEDIDLAWRLTVRRPDVAHCAAFGRLCKHPWSALESTWRTNMRYCRSCNHRIHGCRTVSEAKHYTERGAFVVIDATGPPASDDSHRLPEQLRYLERIAPAEPVPLAMAPREKPADLLGYLRSLLDDL